MVLMRRAGLLHSAWVAGNEVIVKNVNANLPMSLWWFLLPFLAFLCFPASAQPIDSSLQCTNSVSLQKRGCPRLQFCNGFRNLGVNQTQIPNLPSLPLSELVPIKHTKMLIIKVSSVFISLAAFCMLLDMKCYHVTFVTLMRSVVTLHL